MQPASLSNRVMLVLLFVRSYPEAFFDSLSATIRVGLCSFPVHVRVAPWTLHSGSELVDVLHCDSPFWIRAPAPGNGGIGIGSTRTSRPTTVHLLSVNCVGLCVSSAPWLQPSDSANSEFQRNILQRLFFMSCQIPNLYQGFILFMESVKMFFSNTFSPRRQTLLTVSCHAVSRIVLPS